MIRLSSPEGGDSATDTVSDAAVADEAEARDDQRESLLQRFTDEFGDAVVGSRIRPGDDLWVRMARGAWRPTGTFVRDGLGCTSFTFLSAIDWMPSPFGRDMDSQEDIAVHGAEEHADPGARDAADAVVEQGFAGGETRFQALARVWSPTEHFGVTLKADLGDDLTIDSWVPVYAGADWHEREAWEMYGITFAGHPGLRHIYLPGDFEGHPLRKDFPLLARRVKPWPGLVDVEDLPEGFAMGEAESDEAESGAEESGGG